MTRTAQRILLAGLLALVVAGILVTQLRRRDRQGDTLPKRTTRRSAPPPAGPTGSESPSEPKLVRPVTAVSSSTPPINTLGDLHRRLLEVTRGLPTRQRMNAVFELGKALGAEDFDGAFELTKQVPVDWMRQTLAAGIFFSRGRVVGRNLVEDLKNHDERFDLRGIEGAFASGGAIVGWATVDPRAAVDYALKEGDTTASALAYAAWAARDPEAALAAVGASGTILTLAKSDPDRAVNEVLKLDEGIRPAILDRIAHGAASNWSEDYPVDFVSYLLIAGLGDSDDFISQSVVAWWAQFEPEQAIENSVKGGREPKTIIALMAWLEKDPAKAMEWWKAYSLRESRSEQYLSDLVRLAGTNPEQAAKVVSLLPPEDQTSLRGGVLQQWAEVDPRAAFEWAVNQHLKGAELVGVARDAAVNLARWNLDEALAWAHGLTEPSLAAETLPGVALVQACEEPERSLDWIRDLPSGTTRDRCVTAYIRGALEQGKGVAWVNSGMLTDQAPGLPELGTLVRQSNLDDQHKQRLLALIYGWQSGG